MPVAPIPVVTDFSYTELKERVEVLSRRVNSLTAMEVSLIDIDQTPSINITEDNSLLKLPDLSQIDCEQLAEDLIACEIACDEALAIANSKIDCLEDLVLPEQLDGVGAWKHSVSSFKPPYTNDPVTCSASIESGIGAQVVGISQPSGNVTIKWTRVNNDPDCTASGSINWIISPNRSGTPNFSPPWSGARGDTTVVNKDFAVGTYYIYAYGVNLDGNLNTEQYQYKGTFVVSTSIEGDPPVLTPKIVRAFEVTNTITDDEPLPCGVTQPEPEPEP